MPTLNDKGQQSASIKIAPECTRREGIQKLTPDMGLQFLEQNIRGNLANNIRHKENRERGIVFHARFDVQIFLESENSGIANIDSARR